MADWRPIETCPKDISVLVFVPGAAQGMSFEIAHCSSDDPDGYWHATTYDGGPIDIPPTHWMPLPEPPSSVNGVSDE